MEFLYGCLFDQKDMQNYIIILPLQVWDAKCIKRHQVKGKLPQFSSQPVHFALHNTPVLVKKRRKIKLLKLLKKIKVNLLIKNSQCTLPPHNTPVLVKKGKNEFE